MVEIKLTLGNEDIPTVSAWLKEQKDSLPLAAGQPTRKTAAATLLYTVINRIERQIKDHAERCATKDKEDRAARAARK